MIADVQISRMHKKSPYNVSEFVPDVTGNNEYEIFNSPQIQELINKTFGNKLRVSIIPIGKAGQKDFIVNREPKKNRQQIPMKELIKITEQNGNRAVSARELHKFLEVETPFRKWIDRMLENGFEENLDYTRADKNVRGNEAREYALTIDTAKEISMLQRSEKGKQARRYFIEMEKVAINQIQAPAIGKRSKSIVGAKKNELVGVIKTFLVHGDITNIANDLKITASKVQDVFNSGKADKKVIEACFLKAKQNKEELLFGYEEMIEMLKN